MRGGYPRYKTSHSPGSVRRIGVQGQRRCGGGGEKKQKVLNQMKRRIVKQPWRNGPRDHTFRIKESCGEWPTGRSFCRIDASKIAARGKQEAATERSYTLIKENLRADVCLTAPPLEHAASFQEREGKGVANRVPGRGLKRKWKWLPTGHRTDRQQRTGKRLGRQKRQVESQETLPNGQKKSVGKKGEEAEEREEVETTSRQRNE